MKELLTILITALLMLSAGIFILRRPDLAGGEFRLIKNEKQCIARPSLMKTKNAFVLRYMRIIGIGLIISGALGIVYSALHFFNIT